MAACKLQERNARLKRRIEDFQDALCSAEDELLGTRVGCPECGSVGVPCPPGCPEAVRAAAKDCKP